LTLIRPLTVLGTARLPLRTTDFEALLPSQPKCQGVGMVHGIILRAQALLYSIKTLVLGGH
jgi:hypothetical protein